MAKTKRAIAYSRASVKRKIEKTLEKTRATRDKWMTSGSKASGKFATQYGYMFDGQMELAKKLGFDCGCVERGAKLKSGVDCTCFSSRGGQAALSAVGDSTFDGSRCRDSQGNFVPVAQCRGRVVGRDKAGKFVSMKG